MAYVYRHIRLDKDEPFYIGLSKNDDDYKRAYTKHGRHKHWINIVAKTEYFVEIVKDGISYEEAIDTEMFFIKLYGRKDLKNGTLCNRTDGGEGTKNPSDEFRMKISALKKGNTYSKGMRHSESTKALISLKAKLRPRPRTSQSTKDKLSKIHKGRVVPIEWRLKISESTKGRVANNKGKSMSHHQYQFLLKLQEGRHKKVARYSLDGKLINTYKSALLAAKENNIGQGNITNACNKGIMYGGCLWRYEINGAFLSQLEAYEVRVKPVIQTTLDGVFVAEYPSAMEAAKLTGFQKSSILRVCRGMYKQAYNFKWEIKNETKAK